jgi:hypothetical protein
MGAFTSVKYDWHVFLHQRWQEAAAFGQLEERHEPRGTLGTDVDCPITCTEQWLHALYSLLIIYSSIRE